MKTELMQFFQEKLLDGLCIHNVRGTCILQESHKAISFGKELCTLSGCVHSGVAAIN